MSEHNFLVELGTEELPVKALPGLAQALFEFTFHARAGLHQAQCAQDAYC